VVSFGESFKLEVSSVKHEKPVAGRPTSNFTVDTSHSAEGRFCKTKPSLGGLGYMGNGSGHVGRLRRDVKCAKQSQIWEGWGMWVRPVIVWRSAWKGKCAKQDACDKKSRGYRIGISLYFVCIYAIFWVDRSGRAGIL
jgi:hypothetical protein